MTPQELEVSIMWKKKFLEYFKKKFSTIQEENRAYRSFQV